MTAASDSPPNETTVPPTRAEPPSDPLLGKTLDGRFIPRSLLGQGGMGRVYLAEDVRLKRRVALKLMDAALSTDPEFSQRFRREAVVQAQAAHPGIVQVLDAGECAEGAYMVLEYSEGRSLASLMKVGPLRRERALDFAEQLLDVLDFAHRQGIVHRDLKPGNILVEERGGREIVRVLDFGIAKLLQAERPDEGLTLTKPGFGFGTPGYMSLEQATGQPTDHRTDLYAAGVILYQMLGGVLPIKATGISDYLVKLASTEIEPLGERLPQLGVPPALDELLLRALARAPDDRFPSALAFRESLREFRRTDAGQGATQIVTKAGVRGGTVAAKAPSAARGGRGALVVGALLAAAGLAAAAYFRAQAGEAAADADRRVAAERGAAGAVVSEAAAVRESLRAAGADGPTLTAAVQALLARESAARGEAAEAVRLRGLAEGERTEALRERDEADRKRGAADAATTEARNAAAKAESELARLRAAPGTPDAAVEGLRQDLAAARQERDRLAEEFRKATEAAKTAAAAAAATETKLRDDLARAEAAAASGGVGAADRAALEERIRGLTESLRQAQAAPAAGVATWRFRVENGTGGAFDLRDATLYVADAAGAERATALGGLEGRVLPGKSAVVAVPLAGPPARFEARLARMRPGSPVPGNPESLRRTDFSLKDGELVLTIK